MSVLHSFLPSLFVCLLVCIPHYRSITSAGSGKADASLSGFEEQQVSVKMIVLMIKDHICDSRDDDICGLYLCRYLQACSENDIRALGESRIYFDILHSIYYLNNLL